MLLPHSTVTRPRLILFVITATLTAGLLNAATGQSAPDHPATASSSATLVEDATLRLPGHYITPGLADAHTHNLDRSWQRSFVGRYLGEGTLVVQNLTSKSEGTRAFRAYMEDVPSPSVRYANWGFTSTLGPP